MKIKVSEMSGKLKGIQAINTNPLSNDFCQKMNASGKDDIICTHCYSCSMLKAYRRNCVPAFELNSTLLSKELSENDMPKFNNKNDIVRIHAHGELINETHLNNLIKIIEANPAKTFSLYTKRLDIINKYFCSRSKPQNMIMVYSNPTIDAPITTIPQNFDKVFNVMKLNPAGDTINCGGKDCNSCRNCYDLTKDNIIYEMIK